MLGVESPIDQIAHAWYRSAMPPLKCPFLAADAIIELDGGRGIVLIERKNPPPGWAIPGGFVDYGESVEAAAVREAKEETGLDVTLTDLLYVYSDPTRDPRQHTVTPVFICLRLGSGACPRCFSAREPEPNPNLDPTPIRFSSVLRIFVDVVSKWHVKQATARGAEAAKTGAISTANAIHALTMTLLRRVRKLLKRRGLIGSKRDDSESETTQAPGDLAPGFFADIDDTGCILPSAPIQKRTWDVPSQSDDTRGFSIDASVKIAAGDFEGREPTKWPLRRPPSLQHRTPFGNRRRPHCLQNEETSPGETLPCHDAHRLSASPLTSRPAAVLPTRPLSWCSRPETRS